MDPKLLPWQFTNFSWTGWTHHKSDLGTFVNIIFRWALLVLNSRTSRCGSRSSLRAVQVCLDAAGSATLGWGDTGRPQAFRILVLPWENLMDQAEWSKANCWWYHQELDALLIYILLDIVDGIILKMVSEMRIVRDFSLGGCNHHWAPSNDPLQFFWISQQVDCWPCLWSCRFRRLWSSCSEFQDLMTRLQQIVTMDIRCV